MVRKLLLPEARGGMNKVRLEHILSTRSLRFPWKGKDLIYMTYSTIFKIG